MIETTRVAIAKRIGRWTALCALAFFASGCASNHAFVHGARPDAEALSATLATLEEGEEALYELTYIPFLHLDLRAFGKNEESEAYPEGSTFVSLRSWLPLFGIVDADIEFYDVENAAYEKIEILSVLWGVWTRESTTLETTHGERHERNSTLLWILDTGPNVRYDRTGN